jgi:cytochrome c-type biogenesis protein CcmH/NrfG
MNAAVWYAAGVVTGIAVSVSAGPLRRAIATQWRNPALRYGIAIVGVVLCTFTFLVTQLRPSSRGSKPTVAAGIEQPMPASKPAPALEAAAAGLAQRLNEKGGTRDEWLLLARSYEFMGRTTEAQQARASAEVADLTPLVTGTH